MTNSSTGSLFPRRQQAAAAQASGFTLLELLAAIAILSIIVLMIAAIFAESDKAWNVGTGRATNTTEGRAALGVVARDLELAVADNILTFLMRPDRNNGFQTFGFTNSEVNLVSLQNDSQDDNRTAREIQYWVNEDSAVPGRYQLVRSEVSDAILADPMNHCYRKPDWFADRATGTAYATLAENVTGFAVVAPNGSQGWYAGFTNIVYQPPRAPNSYPNMTNLPPYVDVYLEIMNEREAKQLYDMAQRFGPTSAQVKNFVERNARRHTARVYFHNRQGYRWR